MLEKTQVEILREALTDILDESKEWRVRDIAGEALAATEAPAEPIVTCQIYGHEVIGCGECNSNAPSQPVAPEHTDKDVELAYELGYARGEGVAMRDQQKQPVAPAEPRIKFTNVRQLWATAPSHDSTIPSDVFDAMQAMLYGAPPQQREDSSDAKREQTARAICIACKEQPDHVGDARGNQFRWQDYLDVADAALLAIAALPKEQP